MSATQLLGAAKDLVRAIDDAGKLLGAMDKAADATLPSEIAEIVKFHSKGAAIAGVAGGWIPGAGGAAAVAVSAGFIWTMYGRINAKINLPFSDNVVKSVGTGIATNLVAYVIGALLLQTAFSIFPGLGSVGASAIAGATCYALTLASGYIYLKLLTHLFKTGRDPGKMDADELKREARSVAGSDEIKSVIKEARKVYKAAK